MGVWWGQRLALWVSFPTALHLNFVFWWRVSHRTWSIQTRLDWTAGLFLLLLLDSSGPGVQLQLLCVYEGFKLRASCLYSRHFTAEPSPWAKWVFFKNLICILSSLLLVYTHTQCTCHSVTVKVRETVELVLSFHLYLGSRDAAPISGLRWRCFWSPDI